MQHVCPRLVFWTRLIGALVSILIGVVPTASSAQTSSCDAAQPCPVEFGEPAFQTITNPQDANYWTLTLSGPGGFRIELTGLAANYRLYVYAPDTSLAGLSSRDGSADLVVEVQDARPGRYTIVVDSPEGQVTDVPYQLLAIRLLPSVTPPTVDAGCRTPTSWTPSGRGQWCEDAAGAIPGHVDAGDSVLLGNASYADVDVSADVSTPNREASLVVRAQDAANFYVAILIPSGVTFHQAPTAGTQERGAVYLAKRVNGQYQFLTSRFVAPEDSSADRPSRLRILATGPTLRVYLNDVLQLEADDTSFRAGAVGFRIFGDPDFPCDATFANLTIVPR